MTSFRLLNPSILGALLIALGLVAHPSSAQQGGGANATSGQTIESASPATATADEKAAAGSDRHADATLEQKIEEIASSGRILQIGESSSTRLTPAVRLAPGSPPILAFRYFDGQARHRFGDLDLVMDDAGH